MGSFQIRQARPEDWSQVIAWLPETFLAVEEAPACVFVAVRPAGELCGAAVVRQVLDRLQQPLGRFMIYVPPEHRRQGIGTALVTELYRLGLAARFSKLVVFDTVPETADFAPFFTQQGMTSQMTLSRFRFDAEAFRRQLEPRVQFVLGRSPVLTPDQFQSIYELPARGVAEFSAGVGGLPLAIEQQIQQRVYCPAGSVGAVVNGRVVAVLLARRRRFEAPFVERADRRVSGTASVIAPQPYRSEVEYVRIDADFPTGPVSLILIDVALQRSLAAGMISFQYDADEVRYPTFYHMAVRWQAEVVSRSCQFASTPDVWYERLTRHDGPLALRQA